MELPGHKNCVKIHGLHVEASKDRQEVRHNLWTPANRIRPFPLHFSEGFSRELELNLYQGREGTCVFEDNCRVWEELSFLNLFMEHLSPA